MAEDTVWLINPDKATNWLTKAIVNQCAYEKYTDNSCADIVGPFGLVGILMGFLELIFTLVSWSVGPGHLLFWSVSGMAWAVFTVLLVLYIRAYFCKDRHVGYRRVQTGEWETHFRMAGKLLEAAEMIPNRVTNSSWHSKLVKAYTELEREAWVVGSLCKYMQVLEDLKISRSTSQVQRLNDGRKKITAHIEGMDKFVNSMADIAFSVETSTTLGYDSGLEDLQVQFDCLLEMLQIS